jgi:hypothetical protein
VRWENERLSGNQVSGYKVIKEFGGTGSKDKGAEKSIE